MAAAVRWLLPAVLLTLGVAAAATRPSGLAAVDQLRVDAMAAVQALWPQVEANASRGSGADLELLTAYQRLGDAWDAAEVPLPSELGAAWAWARTEGELRGVDALYNTFRRFQRAQTRGDLARAPPRAWRDLAETVLADATGSVPAALARLHDMQLPADGPSLYHQLLLDSGGSLCSMQQSPQQLVYNVYNTAALTELKGYAMMQFSWMLLRLYGKGNFSVEARLMRERYQERTLQKIDAVKAAMAVAKADLYRCDPRHHVEGETYVQLTRLLQGHIQNEVDMNGDNTCRENCGYYSYAKSHGCYHNLYCNQQQRCAGKLIDCKYYDSDMWVCQADASTSRRYNWIEYENGRILGTKGTCRSTKVDSWWRWLFWHCSYCFCLCDEQGPKSDRYFSLRPVTADTANNMVVTGLRLVKHNRVVHFQVQQAPALPRGGVNASAAHWRPVDGFRITDDDVVAGQDYHTLSWEQRAFDLDDLVAPPGHVLTGIRWRRVGTHLNAEIAATALDFAAGTLVEPEHSQWIGNDNTDASLDRPRTQLTLSHPDVPTKSPGASQLDSKSDQYLLFTHTDVDADAAQTTVPFLCAQPVAPEPVTLLAGAGLMHRGRVGYGGFVAPKVLTYDFAQHIHAVYPAEPPSYRVMPARNLDG